MRGRPFAYGSALELPVVERIHMNREAHSVFRRGAASVGCRMSHVVQVIIAKALYRNAPLVAGQALKAA
jgi:hypothetical protein